MRVVHVSSGLVKKAAGVREVVLGLARHQQAMGLDVAVLGLDHPDWDREKHEWSNLNVQVVPTMGPRAIGYAPQMTKSLCQMNPDLVHLHGMWMHPGRSVLQWHLATGRPFFLSPHGMLSDVALSYGSWKKKASSWWFQNEVCRKAAAIHVTSDTEELEVRNYGLDAPVCVVPNGIDDIWSPEFNPGSGRTILSLGRIHKKKALDELVLAWRSLESEYPDWSLLIIGPDEDGEGKVLAKIIRDAGLKRAKIRGPVYGAEKLALMASAGIFALPTRNENFAITVAESLMLGVPVVSSKGAPWSGLEEEGCGLWVPFGSDAMAIGLRRMMSLSDAERRAMGARGREWMLRDFSWLSIAVRLSKAYQQTIENAR